MVPLLIVVLLLLSPVAMGQTKVDLTTQVKSSVMTTNTVPKWTGSTGLANGCELDDGTHAVRCDKGFDVNSLGAYIFWAPNNTVTGTTVNKMACDDGAGKAIICPFASATTNNPLGVAVAANGATPGTTGSTGICIIGFCSVIMDNGATAGHYAQSSSTVDGDLSDVGTTIPTNGQSYWYIFAGNAGAGTAAIFRNLTPSELNSSSVSGGNGKSIQIQINGTAITKPIANLVNGTGITFATANAGNTTTVTPTVTATGGGTAIFLNDTVTGTTTSKIATTNFKGQAILPGLGNQSQMVGICTSGCGTTGDATITYQSDSVACVFDGATTVNDIVIQSPTVSGDCHDTGILNTAPGTSAVTFSGNSMTVLSTNGGAGTYNVRIASTVTGSAPLSASPGILNQFAQWRSSNSLSGSSLWYTTNGTHAQTLATGNMDLSPDFFCSNCAFQVRGAASSDLVSVKFHDAPGSIGAEYAYRINDNSNNFLGGFGPNAEYLKSDQNSGFCGMGSDALVFSSTGSYGRLQKINSTTATADLATSAIGGAIGVGDHGCFNDVYSMMGRARLDLDNGETVGDYLITSTSAAGKGHSVGAVWPFTGQIVGQAYATNGGATTLTKYIQYGAEVRGGAYGLYNNDLLAQVALVADTTMFTVGGTTSDFRFSGGTACTTSSAAATATLNLKYTDTSGTAQTVSVTSTCTTLGSASVSQITQSFRAKNATAITFGVTIANTPTYDVFARLEALGPN